MYLTYLLLRDAMLAPYYAMVMCVSVRLSQIGVLSKRLKHSPSQTYNSHWTLFIWRQIRDRHSNGVTPTVAPNRDRV